MRTWLLDDDGETQRRALHHKMMSLQRYFKQQPPGTLSPATAWEALSRKFSSALPFQRTIIYIDGAVTQLGQFVAIRGQLCETPTKCSDVRFRPFSMNNPGELLQESWRAFLTVFSKSHADSIRHKQSLDLLTFDDDAALDWVCNEATQEERDDQTTFDIDGYGFDPALDELGLTTAWRFDAYVDAPFGSWLQFKALVVTVESGAVQWERDISAVALSGSEALADARNNHAARVGFVTTIAFNKNEQRVTVLDPAALGDVSADALQNDGTLDVSRRLDGDGAEAGDGSAVGDAKAQAQLMMIVAICVGVLAVCLALALVMVALKWKAAVKHSANATRFEQMQEDTRL